MRDRGPNPRFGLRGARGVSSKLIPPRRNPHFFCRRQNLQLFFVRARAVKSARVTLRGKHKGSAQPRVLNTYFFVIHIYRFLSKFRRNPYLPVFRSSPWRNKHLLELPLKSSRCLGRELALHGLVLDGPTAHVDLHAGSWKRLFCQKSFSGSSHTRVSLLCFRIALYTYTALKYTGVQAAVPCIEIKASKLRYVIQIGRNCCDFGRNSFHPAVISPRHLNARASALLLLK